MLHDKELPPRWMCGREICRCRNWDNTGWAWNPRGCPWWVLVDDVNARMIVAAPDMLAALRGLVSQILEYEQINNLAPNPGRKYCWDATECAVAAIAKAEGTAR